jgi:nucleotide-binding universal stress UspA family protein/cytidylate kinase
MGEEVAEHVAAELGYKCISRRVLLEAAEEFSVPELLLERALHDAPSRLDRVTHSKDRFVAIIRQAFLEQIQQDNVVYHGLAGQFFVEGVSHVLKVRIFTDLEERIRREMERDGVSRERARQIIAKDDKDRHDWSLAMYGIDSSDARLYDLVLHLLKIRVSDAVSIICKTVDRPYFETTAESQKVLDNLVLGAQAKSAIVEKWPTADVSSLDGNVLVHIDQAFPSDSGVTEQVTSRIKPIRGVKSTKVIFYSHKQEVKSNRGLSVVLLDEKQSSAPRRDTRILVPMANPQTQDALVAVARALLRQEGGEIVALSVVTAPEQADVHSVLAKSKKPIELLDHASEISRPAEVGLRQVVHVSPNLGKGISQAAQEEGCSLVVMGYSGEDKGEHSLAAELLNEASTDLIFVKLKGKFPPRRIAVSLGGTVNQNLKVRLAGMLADEFDGDLTFLSVLPVDYSYKQRSECDQIVTDAVRQHTARAIYRTELIVAEDVVESLVAQSKEFDLLIMGTTKVGIFERDKVGSVAAQVVEKAECSVAVVRVISPVKKTLKHLRV